jgi:four helix bundle protein
MTPEEMKRRTRAFGVQVIKLVENLPRGRSADVVARQLVSCSTSVGSNYRAACLARSRAEFASKLQIALEEADESQYWLEVLRDSELSSGALHEKVYKESNEITAILMPGLKTTRGLR